MGLRSLLAYPFDPLMPVTPHAEQNSPWSLEDGKRIALATLPHYPPDAVEKLRGLLTQVVRLATGGDRLSRLMI